MHKVVYNSRYGGFGLSDAAIAELKALGMEPSWASPTYEQWDGIVRHDPRLVDVVERLGRAADGPYARLAIRTVEGMYLVTEYDGLEEVIEPGDEQAGWVTP